MSISRITKSLGFIFLSVILIILIAGILFFLLALGNAVAAAIIAASATALVSVLSVVGAKYIEKRQEIEQEIRANKIPIYVDFVKFVMGLLLNKPGQSQVENPTLAFAKEFTPNLIVWGTEDIIIAWSRFRRQSVTKDEKDTETVERAKETSNAIFAMEDIFIAMRRDLGHKDKHLTRGDILGLFVNDIDKYL